MTVAVLKQVHHCCYVGCRDDTPTIHLSLLESLREQLKRDLCFFDREKGCTCNACATIDSFFGVEAKKCFVK